MALLLSIYFVLKSVLGSCRTADEGTLECALLHYMIAKERLTCAVCSQLVNSDSFGNTEKMKVLRDKVNVIGNRERMVAISVF